MMNENEKAIAAQLTKYQDALNHSDTEAVMKLYAADGVFMPQHFPSSVGADAVRKAYAGVFQTITLTVKFAVAEIKQVASDWALARTNSAGSVKVNATGQTSPEANQELFLFQKVGNEWKIARYCFSTTNPPRS
ncbi:MAG TPA: SgcJ/EcaC family oxidoreductase [Terriglobales bacterium]|nr:SgcJ/EcaC family oxidoreductase [Terriglobales bacterium]